MFQRLAVWLVIGSFALGQSGIVFAEDASALIVPPGGNGLIESASIPLGEAIAEGTTPAIPPEAAVAVVAMEQGGSPGSVKVDESGGFGPHLFGNLALDTRNAFQAARYLGLGGVGPPQMRDWKTYEYPDGTRVRVKADGRSQITFGTPGGIIDIYYDADGRISTMILRNDAGDTLRRYDRPSPGPEEDWWSALETVPPPDRVRYVDP